MEEEQLCLVNITAAGRRRRLMIGAVVLSVTLAAHIVVHPEAASFLPILELPLVFFGWLCLVQSLENT